jgi:hypothetical protein
VTFIVGIVIAVVAGLTASDDRDVWTEVSKAGVSIALITVAGAIGSVAVKRADERRAREAELRRILHIVLDAYNGATAARRNLRAIGLPEPDQDRLLGDDQIRELRAVLAELNDHQLGIEAVAREIPHSGLFRDPDTAVSSLRCAEDFINKSAIRTWEHTGGQLWPGRDVSFANLRGLDEFIGRKRDGFGQFEQWVSTPLDRFIEQISQEISPKAKGAQVAT